jgi:hypothetical protein
MSSEQSAAGQGFRYGAALAGQIEMKWQRIWADQGTFDVPNPVGGLSNGEALDPARKFFVMDMFPYPSGAGLHVGHPLGYIASDVYARYMRNGSSCRSSTPGAIPTPARPGRSRNSCGISSRVLGRPRRRPTQLACRGTTSMT